MIKEYTIEELATKRINHLICALQPDDQRWVKIISIRGWMDDFNKWLKDNNLEYLPMNAKTFISKKEKEIYGEQDWEGFLKAKAENEDSWHYISFYNILEKRLKEHKAKPYKGKLTIGHYVGIKKNIDDDPYQYENHDIGQIEDYKEEPDGHISIYVLSKPDNTEVTLPVEMTYRIY